MFDRESILRELENPERATIDFYQKRPNRFEDPDIEDARPPLSDYEGRNRTSALRSKKKPRSPSARDLSNNERPLRESNALRMRTLSGERESPRRVDV
jgi:hypothetical protein